MLWLESLSSQQQPLRARCTRSPLASLLATLMCLVVLSYAVLIPLLSLLSGKPQGAQTVAGIRVAAAAAAATGNSTTLQHSTDPESQNGMLKQALVDRLQFTTDNGDENNIESPLEWQQRVHEQVDWEPGNGLKNVSGRCRSALNKKFLPKFATSKTYHEYLDKREESRKKRERDIDALMDSIHSSNRTLRPCLRFGNHHNFVPFEKAFEASFASMGINITVFNADPDTEQMEECDIIIRKGMRTLSLKKYGENMVFPHTILWELPMIWRTDPVNASREWGFISWDNLNGYSMALEHLPDDRWKHYFAPHQPVQPWRGVTSNGYALIIGQVPSDTAVVGGVTRYNADVFSIYRMAIASIQAQVPSLPIIFRPHPLTHTKNNHCPELDEQLPGAVIRTDKDEPLEQALEGAALVVSISSSAAVESVLRGIPTITLDYESPSYDVTCHSFKRLEAILNGTACRPPRSEWLHRLAYTLWTIEDIANGNLLRFLFRLGPQRWSDDDNNNQTQVGLPSAL